MNWSFSPDQFILAWEATGVDSFPYPLNVRTTARTADERALHLTELQLWREAEVDGDVEVALRILASPSICVSGLGARGADNQLVRLVGAAVGRTAAVVTQDPGETDDTGGNLHLWLGESAHMTARLAAGLQSLGAGRRPRMQATLSEVQWDPTATVMVSPKSKSVAAQIRTLLNQQRSGLGQFIASTRLDSGRQRPSQVLSWLDIDNDGRYLVRTRTDVSVQPAGTDVVAAEISRLIAEADRAPMPEPASRA